MNKYSVDSIEPKFCFKTNPNILENIKICQNCSNIPIPCFRSHKEPKNTFCKSCYFSINKNLEFLSNPAYTELKLLEKLILSCENYEMGCQEEFTIKSLDKLWIHHQICSKKQPIPNLNKCKRCSSILHRDKLHNCQFLKVNQKKINQELKIDIQMIVNEALSKQSLIFEEKNRILEDKINYLALDNENLNQTVQNMQKFVEIKINQSIGKIFQDHSLFPNDKSKNQIANIRPKQVDVDINNKITTEIINKQEDQAVFKNPCLLNKFEKRLSKIHYQNDSTTLKGHEATVYTLIQLNDSKIASCSFDKTIKVWDLFTNKCILTLKGHDNYISSLIQLSDGIIASCSWDKTIKLWDLTTYQCISTLTGHENTVRHIIQLKNGKIASSSGDKTIKIWDFKKNECTLTLKGHDSTVHSLIQLNDGKLASCSSDKTIRLWDIRANKCTFTHFGHENSVNCLVQLSEYKIASASDDKTIKIWNFKNNYLIHTIYAHDNPIFCLILLQDGRIASGSGDYTIKLWDLEKDECTYTLKGHNDFVRSLIQLKDGRIASASNDKLIKIWE